MASSNTLFAPRTVEIEAFVAQSDHANVSSTFASNYLTTPVKVFNKKNVMTPDWTARPRRLPSAFDFKLPFDTPFPYAGTTDLLWEIVITNTKKSCCSRNWRNVSAVGANIATWAKFVVM